MFDRLRRMVGHSQVAENPRFEIAFGDVQYHFPGSENEAILEAKTRLEDDPELGEVEVYRDGCFLGRATHVPNQRWETVVAWLWDGEHILPPAGIPPIDDGEGYDLSDPKHPTYHERMSDFADLRD